jgi:hypothetical protein
MILSLRQIADEKRAFTTDQLNLQPDRRAAIELQKKLVKLGLLDPLMRGSKTQPFGPSDDSDGIIGINTRSALYEFCRLAKIRYVDRQLSPKLILKLLAAEPETFLPIDWETHPRDGKETRLAKRILRYMRSKGYWIARSPNMMNIVYVEGMNDDGTLNDDAFDHWNDRRMVIRIAPGGKPEFLVNDQSTTEPGKFYTMNPLNPLGAARIAFGQYKAWTVGLHQNTQPALVQRGDVRVHRDLDKNGKRSPSDPIDIGNWFGINQHSTAKDKIPATIGLYSAGCLVGRRYAWHLKFLSTVKKDVRFKRNAGYLFVTAVLAGDDLVKKEPN